MTGTRTTSRPSGSPVARVTDPAPLAVRGKTSRGQRTRRRLIWAAEKVFGDVGFYDARVSEITRAAGVALGTFYLYFRSKHELFDALIQAINHDLRRTLSEGTQHLSSRADAEARGLEIFFYDFLPRHRKLYRIIKQAEFANPRIFEWYYRRIADGYAQRLRAAMDAGEFRRWDGELAAFALMGIADFVAMRYVTWGDGLPREKLDELTDFALRGLATDGGPNAPNGRRPSRALRGSRPRRTAPAPPGSKGRYGARRR